jgi:hypothetical protein
MVIGGTGSHRVKRANRRESLSHIVGIFLFEQKVEGLLVKTVLVQVLYKTFPDTAYRLLQRFKAELPEQMFLKSFGAGKSPFEKFAPLRGFVIAVLTDKARIRGGFKIVIFFFTARVGVQGKQGFVFQDFKSGVPLQFLLYFLSQLNNRKPHQFDRQMKLRVHPETCFLNKKGPLKLHSKLLLNYHSLLRICQACNIPESSHRIPQEQLS